jgi:hypothetical protein
VTEGLHPNLHEGAVDPDQDRYPSFADVLSRLLDDGPLLDRQVERVEIHLYASGEATYRVWEPRSEEPEGGYYASVNQ